MKLIKARVMDYRSVNDSTEFEIEADKTIAVGANEAGKTALMRALQTVNPPDGEDSALNALRDYPRARYTDIPAERLTPARSESPPQSFPSNPTTSRNFTLSIPMFSPTRRPGS